MSLRIEVTELGLPALDSLQSDALVVFVGPERPLQGLAGYADWRLCGALSRAIRQGLFSPEMGEVLLLPSDGRLAATRIFCFGTREAMLSSTDIASLAQRTCDAMARAQIGFFAASLPVLRSENASLGARLWLEASLKYPHTRQVILGEVRALQRDFLVAQQDLNAEVEIVAPPVRVEMPPRPVHGLMPRGAVVR